MWTEDDAPKLKALGFEEVKRMCLELATKNPDNKKLQKAATAIRDVQEDTPENLDTMVQNLMQLSAM